MLRRSAVLCSLAVALLLDSGAVRAEGLAFRVFVGGHTPGEPSTGKQATAYSLYALSGLSLVAGGYFLTEWSAASTQRDDFNTREPDACASLVSESCATASRLDEDKNSAMNLALGGFATGATLALSGVLVAEFWPNLALEPEVVLLPGTGFASATLRF